MKKMEEMKEEYAYVMDWECITPLGVWFSSKISVDGLHLKALKSLKMRLNAMTKQASQTPHTSCAE